MLFFFKDIRIFNYKIALSLSDYIRFVNIADIVLLRIFICFNFSYIVGKHNMRLISIIIVFHLI